MTFCGALELLYVGEKVRREEWVPGKTLVLVSDEDKTFRKQSLYTVRGDARELWTAMQLDILADDWVVVF